MTSDKPTTYAGRYQVILDRDSTPGRKMTIQLDSNSLKLLKGIRLRYGVLTNQEAIELAVGYTAEHECRVMVR